MKMIELDFNPDARTLRQFGWIALVAFPLVGGICYWHGGLFGFDFGQAARTVSVVFVGLGGTAGLLAWLAPRALRPLYVGLLLITAPIGFVLSYVILGVLFYLLITPMALVLRLVGYDPLKRKFEREAETYWVEVEPRASKDSYFRQF